jgi:hypothetical protein
MKKECRYAQHNWYISGTTIQFIFCQIRLNVVSLVSIMTHPPRPQHLLTEPVFWQKSPAGTGKQTGKTWFGLEK